MWCFVARREQSSWVWIGRTSLRHEDSPELVAHLGSVPWHPRAMLGQSLLGFAGLAVLVGIAWLASLNRRAVDWKEIPEGILLNVAS